MTLAADGRLRSRYSIVVAESSRATSACLFTAEARSISHEILLRALESDWWWRHGHRSCKLATDALIALRSLLAHHAELVDELVHALRGLRAQAVPRRHLLHARLIGSGVVEELRFSRAPESLLISEHRLYVVHLDLDMLILLWSALRGHLVASDGAEQLTTLLHLL